jgi:hypothetical protein
MVVSRKKHNDDFVNKLMIDIFQENATSFVITDVKYFYHMVIHGVWTYRVTLEYDMVKNVIVLKLSPIGPSHR